MTFALILTPKIVPQQGRGRWFQLFFFLAVAFLEVLAEERRLPLGREDMFDDRFMRTTSL